MEESAGSYNFRLANSESVWSDRKDIMNICGQRKLGKWIWICMAVSLALFNSGQLAEAVTVVSWHGLLQTGGDLSLPSQSHDGYSQLSASLTEDGHAILPGVFQLTPDALSEASVFVWGVTSNKRLSSNEMSTLRDWVEAGGTLIVEADSALGDRVSANDAFEAVFGTSPDGSAVRPLREADLFSGGSGSEAGRVLDVSNAWTVGPYGDLRGQSFGTTVGASIDGRSLNDIGGEAMGVAGIGAGVNFIARMQPFAEGGEFYYLGDQLLSNQFTRLGERFYNPSNLAGIRNLLASLSDDPIISPPGDCDLNGDGSCDTADIDELSGRIRNGSLAASFDLDANGALNDDDRRIWVEDLMRSFFGDSNLDLVFDSSDLVAVFAAGTYEDSVPGNSGWAEGDWNGDGEFDSGDLVVAFTAGAYENGPRAAVVPEPSATWLAMLGAISLAFLRICRRRARSVESLLYLGPSRSHLAKACCKSRA